MTKESFESEDGEGKLFVEEMEMRVRSEWWQRMKIDSVGLDEMRRETDG
jgi:hypothetical protein